MPTINQREERAQRARQNGAKSTGPKTPEGLYRSRTASYKSGLYATRNCMLPGESNDEYLEIKAQLYADWQPIGFQAESLVNQLAVVFWELKRAQAGSNDHMHDLVVAAMKNAPNCLDQAKLNLEAEKLSCRAESGTAARFQAKINYFDRRRERLTRELLRLEKRTCTSVPSQKSLEINRRFNPEIPATGDAQPVEGTLAEAPYIVEASVEVYPHGTRPEPMESAPEPAPEPQPITEWAKEALNFNADKVQEQILTETSKRILVLAPRQTGKSTAAAVRVVYEAVHKDNATILLASASGRQSGQILQKARQLARSLDISLFGPPPQCEGFTLANGASVIALPDSQETIRGFSAPSLIVVDEAAFASESLYKALERMLTVSNGTLMLLSTPNGQLGYFYDQWHLEKKSPWAKIFGTLADCPRVSPEAVERIKASMAKEDFQQEFECKFVCAGGQFISMETVRKCLRTDFELFCPDWDREE